MELKLSFLDVGQGDGIHILFPDGTTMQVDLGSTKNKALVGSEVDEFFTRHTRFATKGETLDYVVFTHGDIDHYNLFLAFMQKFRPKIGNLLFGGNESDYGKTISTIRQVQKVQGNTVNQIADPQAYPTLLGNFGGATVDIVCMNAPASKRASAWVKNTSSVCLQIAYAGHKVMLTGDATIDTEAAILAGFQTAGHTLAELESIIWKVQHHGSLRTSIRPSWVGAVKPQGVFISSDRSGSLGFGLKNTGHRLPQEAAIDVIRANTVLGHAAAAHSYVSSYDPDDYTGYTNPDDGASGLADKFAAAGNDKEWLTASTTEGIYTTLLEMDKTFANGQVADLGVRYDLTISDSGAIDISST